jgi:hypothetical protein
MMHVHYLLVVRLHYENQVPPIPFVAPRTSVVRFPYSGVIAPKTGTIIGE